MCTDGQWVLSLTDHGAQVTAYHAPTDTVLIADTWPKTQPGVLHVYMHALLVDLTSPCVPLLTIPCLVHVFCVRLRQTRSHTLARCVSLALSDTHTFPRLTHPRSPVWAPLEGLLAAMQTTDKASSQPRGLLLLLPPEERC